MDKDIKALLEYSNMTPLERSIADALQRTKKKKVEIRTEERELSPEFKNDLIAALRKTKYNARAENKLKIAKASSYPTARLEGRIKVVASVSNPLTTELEIIISLLDVPNQNKQGIRRSEAQNIIDTSLHMPLKVNYDGRSISGHVGASVTGVITSVSDATDRIIGKALLWHEQNEDLLEHLKEQKDSLFTSWEIYYTNAERDHNGVSWLSGCIFAGIALVSNPAYGKENSKARIL